ncbi:MAG: glycosyltransferase [Pseudomonadota bacterium]
MTKVLHICETAKGGPATYLNLIADAVGRINNAIVVPLSHASYLDADLRQYRFGHTRRSVGSLIRMVRMSLKAMREEKPDLLFFHSTFSLLALIVLKLCRVRTPSLYCAHGWAAHRYDEGSFKRKLTMRIESLLSGFPDMVICVSKHDLNFAREHGYRGNYQLVENGVPDRVLDARSDLFLPKPGEPARTNLLYVGRFDRQKGLDILLEAADRIVGPRPDLHLHVVGAAVLEAPAVRRDLANVTFHGWVPRARIDDWFGSVDALVVPSRWEGLPLVIPEAYRNGTPVIASTRTGMAALIDEGKTGYTFDLSVDNLANILELVSSETLRSMRPAARRLFDQRFHADRLREHLGMVYNQVLAKAGRLPTVKKDDKSYASAA